jgi:hypothetical protein
MLWKCHILEFGAWEKKDNGNKPNSHASEYKNWNFYIE